MHSSIREERESARGGAPATLPKKVAVFVGSPQKGGATFRAASTFAEKLGAFGDAEVEIVRLADYNLGVCRGCKLCLDRGEELCPLKDDRDVLIGKMLAADGAVFASPNYSFGVAAVMKIFLDRLGYLFHRPRFHGKTSSAIVVQGIYGGRKVRKYLEFVGGALGFNVVRGSVIRTLAPMTPEALGKMDAALEKQARRFHDRLLLPPHRSPGLFPLAMFRLSRTAMRQSGRVETRDYAFYAERDWFESDYYYPTHLGPLKRAFGAFVDWAIAHTSTFKVATHEDEAGGGQPASVR